MVAMKVEISMIDLEGLGDGWIWMKLMIHGVEHDVLEEMNYSTT